MFAGLLLTGLGSGYYHLAPDNQRLIWDRLPMTIAMAGFIGALLVDRFEPKVIAVVPVLMALGMSVIRRQRRARPPARRGPGTLEPRTA